ncbi:hypothetical protein M427DRAFT_496356 [Gonapodya prolifera JEL478]|uniref:Protein FAM72 n=1 Tax=Gonapodya prolifera (strain JEL478) TaxID=1344416 RepID=A0A139AGJ4_GONPJ|nr:hypothetical protein M427DRAFT_496356 [Gonapodya prolifera JEL478]|eukprot:KXS15868.1 hypothetical protein M427DRAFT_496356 [Gonapodya prolifera JEL478]
MTPPQLHLSLPSTTSASNALAQLASSISSLNQASAATVASASASAPGATTGQVQSTTHQAAQQGAISAASLHPQFRSKPVVELECSHCTSRVCGRGMRAILLGDTRVELFSTDLPPPKSVALVEKDYRTRSCRCRIRDVACLVCGCVVGYHVTRPCERCLGACNNGHYWMFLSEAVRARDRLHPTSHSPMTWAALPAADSDPEGGTCASPELGKASLAKDAGMASYVRWCR